MKRGIQPNRIRQARELNLLTLDELAAKVDVTKASLSYYEKGDRSPSAATLQSLAHALDVPLNFFFKEPGYIESSDRSAVNYRSLESVRRVSKERARSLALLEMSAQLVDELSEAIQFQPANLPELVDGDIDPLELTDSDIEAIAIELRTAWGLGRGPISNMALLMENNSIPVVAMELSKGMDGVSTWFGSRPFVIVSSEANYFRTRMNLAHELGHLVLHRALDKDRLKDKGVFRSVESQAWRFAGAFLMPAGAFSNEVFALSLDGILSLKKRWGIAVSAMVRRLKDLSLIDEKKFKFLNIQISQRGWRKSEPFDEEFQPEPGQLLQQAARSLHDSGRLMLDDLARLTALPISFLENALRIPRHELLAIQPESNVVAFKLRA